MRVEVLVHLKCGLGEYYQPGDKFESPDIPPVLLNEIFAKTGTVRVLEEVVPVPPIKEEKESEEADKVYEKVQKEGKAKRIVR